MRARKIEKHKLFCLLTVAALLLGSPLHLASLAESVDNTCAQTGAKRDLAFIPGDTEAGGDRPILIVPPEEPLHQNTIPDHPAILPGPVTDDAFGETEPDADTVVFPPEEDLFAVIPVAPPMDADTTDIVADAVTTVENDSADAGIARQNASGFSVIIPGSLTLCADTSEMDIAVDGVMDGETILLTFHSENGFHLTDGVVAIPYTLFLGETAVCADTAYSCTVSGGRIALRAEIEPPRFAGNYADLLRFSISLPSRSASGQPESARSEQEAPEPELSESGRLMDGEYWIKRPRSAYAEPEQSLDAQPALEPPEAARPEEVLP